MNNFHKVLRALYDHLNSNQLLNSVTVGDITQIDFTKTSDYAFGHILLEGVDLQENVDVFNCSVVLMDRVSEHKTDRGFYAVDQAEGTDALKGLDNYQFAINQMLSVAKYFIEHLRRGDLHDNLFHLDGEPSIEFFKDRFEDEVAGVVVSFSIQVPSNIGVCV